MAIYITNYMEKTEQIVKPVPTTEIRTLPAEYSVFVCPRWENIMQEYMLTTNRNFNSTIMMWDLVAEET